MTAPLDADLVRVLALLPKTDMGVATPASFRAMMRDLAAARAAVPPPEVAAIADVALAGAGGALRARVYRPTAQRAPTVVYFHGGGWVAGDLETHDRPARLLAIETGAVVVAVDYRRPPETRFPGAFDDALAALRDVAARIGEFGGDARRLAVAGDSAGGNLAAAVAIACRDAGLPLAAQLLIYPVTDVAGRYADPRENARFASREANADGYFLTLPMMAWFAGHYLADDEAARDWRASPLRAPSLAGVAPAVVCTAGFDPLRDEGEAYADALEAAGVALRRHRGAGLIHGYFGMGETSAAARAEAARARRDFRALIEA